MHITKNQAASALLMAGVANAETLAVITPCSQAPASSSFTAITVTEQYQPVSTCNPSSACIKGSCTTQYPFSTWDYVSTTIPCDWNGTAATSTVVTSTDQLVTVSEWATTVTSYVTPSVTAYYNGTNGTTATPTPVYQTIAKQWVAPYDQLGAMAIPGWEGSGLCTDCAVKDDETSTQVLEVTECRSVSGGSGPLCVEYAETWISEPAPSSTSQTAVAVWTSAVASTTGAYTWSFQQVAPACTFGSGSSMYTAAPSPYWVYVSETCTEASQTFDFTTTVTATVTYWDSPSTSCATSSSRVAMPTGGNSFPGFPAADQGSNGWSDWNSESSSSSSSSSSVTENIFEETTINNYYYGNSGSGSEPANVYWSDWTSSSTSTTTSFTNTAGPLSNSVTTSSTSTTPSSTMTTTSSSTSSFTNTAGPLSNSVTTSSTSSSSSSTMTTTSSSTSSFMNTAGPLSNSVTTSSTSSSSSTSTTSSSSSSTSSTMTTTTTSSATAGPLSNSVTTTTTSFVTAPFGNSTTSSSSSTMTSTSSTLTTTTTTSSSMTSTTSVNPFPTGDGFYLTIIINNLRYHKRDVVFVGFSGEDAIGTSNQADASLFYFSEGILSTSDRYFGGDASSGYVILDKEITMQLSSTWMKNADSTFSLTNGIGFCLASDNSLFAEITSAPAFTCVEVVLAIYGTTPTSTTTTGSSSTTTTTSATANPSDDLDVEPVKRGMSWNEYKKHARRLH